MLVKKDKFIDAIKLLDLVPSKPGMPSSEFIRIIEAEKTADLVLTLSGDVLGESVIKSDSGGMFKKPFFMDRRVIVPFLTLNQRTKADEISIELDKTKAGKQLTMKIGRRKIILTSLVVSGHTSIPKQTGVQLPNKRSIETFDCALKYASADQSIPQLNCISVKNQYVISSNDRTIFCAWTPIKDTAMFPLFLAGLLDRSGIEEVWAAKKSVSIVTKNGILFQQVPEQAITGFPRKKMTELYRSSEASRAVFSVQAKTLLAALNRFNQYLNSAKDKVISISGSLDSKNVIQIKGEVSHAVINDRCIVEAVTKDFSLIWPLDMILPFVSFLAEKGKTISIRYGKDTPYYLVSKTATLIVGKKN